jgi:hypothetical protein
VATLPAAARVEFNQDPPPRNPIESDAPAHPPQKDNRVKFICARIAERPTRSPFSKEIDESLEFASGWRQSVFGPVAAGGNPSLQYSGSFQPPQPLDEKRAGHVGKTAFKLIEMINIGKKLADDQHRPTVGENFRRPGHRTVLPITVHAWSVAGAGIGR